MVVERLDKVVHVGDLQVQVYDRARHRARCQSSATFLSRRGLWLRRTLGDLVQLLVRKQVVVRLLRLALELGDKPVRAWSGTLRVDGRRDQRPCNRLMPLQTSKPCPPDRAIPFALRGLAHARACTQPATSERIAIGKSESAGQHDGPSHPSSSAPRSAPP